MKRYWILCLPLLFVLSAACTTTRPLRTRTGKPEIVVRGVDGTLIASFLREEALRRGFHWEGGNDRRARFSCAGTPETSLFFWREREVPILQVTCEFRPTPTGTYVVADLAMITGRGTDKEETSDVSRQTDEAHAVQKLLQATHASAALARHEAAVQEMEQVKDGPTVWGGNP